MPAGPNRVLRHPFPEIRRGVVGRRHPEQLAIEPEDECAVGAAEGDRSLGDGVENRLQVECRTADDLQQVRSRGLLPQRLLQVARAGLDLVEQPRILDRDHGLVGEGLHQFDLAIGKGLDAPPRQHEISDRLPVAQQRDTERRSGLALSR